MSLDAWAPPIRSGGAIYTLAAAQGTQQDFTLGGPIRSVTVDNNSPFTVWIKPGKGSIMPPASGSVPTDPSVIPLRPFTHSVVPLDDAPYVTARVDIPKTSAAAAQTPTIVIGLSPQPSSFTVTAIAGAAVATLTKNAAYTATPALLWQPASGKTIRLWTGLVECSIAGTLRISEFTDATMATEVVALAFIPKAAADTPYFLDPFYPNGQMLRAADHVLGIVAGGGGNAGGYATGSEE